MKGKFITFEGSEGSGKSTQSELLYQYLKNKGFKTVVLREPGGTKVSEKIRGILLDSRNEAITPVSEALLYMAARSQLVRQIIKPALREGKIVICDRFLDSTFAYQGYGLGINMKLIKDVGNLVTEGITPDLTIVLDLPVAKGLSRHSRVKDRIERRPLDFHLRVRRGYFKLAGQEPGRVKIIRADMDKDKIQEKIRRLAEALLKLKSRFTQP